MKATSDTHGEILEMEGIWLHAGDMIPYGVNSREAMLIYEEQFSKADKLFFVLGNIDDENAVKEVLPSFPNVKLLDNEIVTIRGIRVLGISRLWEREALDELFPKADIVLCHVPPFEACDKTFRGENVGDLWLREAILRHKPKLFICGHIHEAAGSCMLGATKVLNVAKRIIDVEEELKEVIHS